MDKPPQAQHVHLIKQKALQLGFDACGIAKADFLATEAPRLEAFLNQNHHGNMAWLANHFDKRLDPRKLFDGAKSVISVLLNYLPAPPQQQPNNTFKIAKYAYGEDYHFVIKRKLKDLLQYIQNEIGQVQGRAFVDSAPVMDKAWAQRSGLGWVGKNTNLLNKKMGSFFLIGELIIDLPLPPDAPTTANHCGTCTRCIDACPTDALNLQGQIDARKCISYLTIELRNNIPNQFDGKANNWIFGCDICQDVCPWNRHAKPHHTPEFNPHPNLQNLTTAQWHELTEEVFKQIFKKSAVKRTKYEGLKRNIKWAAGGAN